MPDNRALLRARMSVERSELPAKRRVEAAVGVLRSIETLPAFKTATNVAGYWAIRGELPLNLVVACLQRRGQHYFLPVLGKHRQLGFAEYAPGAALASNHFGIPEPAVPAAQLRTPRDMQVILLPLLAFDRTGCRLGFGGGWYDTSLAFLLAARRPASPLLVGVGYSFQDAGAIAAESWDVPLDYVATDEALITCKPRAAAHV
ncbi:MAG TPA: 5-formyltetrahydrofolate cyclo-ligase [Rhodanobacteraceae bacterium]